MTSHKAKGPAEAATSPDHGSINSAKDTDMNVKTNITAPAGTASGAIDLEGTHGQLEDLAAALIDLRHKSFLLMRQAEDALDPDRGTGDRNVVSLSFSRASLEALRWLTGQIWSDAVDVLQGTEKLISQLEENRLCVTSSAGRSEASAVGSVA